MVTKKDMVLLTTMARRRAMDTTRNMDRIPSTATALAREAVATMARVTTSIANLTMMTLAMARSRTTEMLDNTRRRINMLAKNPMATKRPTAIRRSTANLQSTPSTTNMPKKINMEPKKDMELKRAMVRSTLIALMAIKITEATAAPI